MGTMSSIPLIAILELALHPGVNIGSFITFYCAIEQANKGLWQA